MTATWTVAAVVAVATLGIAAAAQPPAPAGAGQDRVAVFNQSMKALPDGALYAAQTTLEAKAKNSKVSFRTRGITRWRNRRRRAEQS